MPSPHHDWEDPLTKDKRLNYALQTFMLLQMAVFERQSHVQYLTRDPKSTFSHMACITSQLSVRESLKLVILNSSQKHSLSELVTPSSTPFHHLQRLQSGVKFHAPLSPLLRLFSTLSGKQPRWGLDGQRKGSVQHDELANLRGKAAGIV